MGWLKSRLFTVLASTLPIVAAVGAVLLFSWRPRTVSQWLGVVFSIVWWQRFAASGFRTLTIYPFKCLPVRNATRHYRNQSVIVTGSGPGSIGYWTSLELAKRGTTVVLTTRSQKTAEKTAREIAIMAGVNPSQVVGLELQLSDVKSVDNFVERVLDIDKKSPVCCLINNAAGVRDENLWMYTDAFGGPDTDDLVELNIAGNFLGPHLLTKRLIPTLLKNSIAGCPTRVVFVASGAHRVIKTKDQFKKLWGESAVPVKAVTPDALKSEKKEGSATIRVFKQNSLLPLQTQFQVYAFSKLGNIASCLGFSKKYESTKIEFTAVHPGIIPGSNIFDNNMWKKVPYQPILRPLLMTVLLLFAKTPMEASGTQLHCCLAGEVVHGGYYVDQSYSPNMIGGVATEEKNLLDLFHWAERQTALTTK